MDEIHNKRVEGYSAPTDVTVEITLPYITPETLQKTVVELLQQSFVRTYRKNLDNGNTTEYSTDFRVITQDHQCQNEQHNIHVSRYTKVQPQAESYIEKQLSQVTDCTASKQIENSVISNMVDSDSEQCQKSNYLDTQRSRIAVVSLETFVEEQAVCRLFGDAIVSIEELSLTHVDGISPLYVVNDVEQGTSHTAVLQLSTAVEARELLRLLQDVEHNLTTRYTNTDIDIDLIDYEGVVCNEEDCVLPWKPALSRTGILAPWLDMNPDAMCGKDPVAYLLATCQDTVFSGPISYSWIVGEEQ